MDEPLGNPGQLLGVASGAAQDVQAQKNYQNNQNIAVADKAMQPQQAQGVARGQAQGAVQGNSILINKQLATALGEPRLEGTKMAPEMYGALAKIQGAKDYHNQLIDDRDKRDELDRQAKADAQTKKEQADEKAAAEKADNEAKSELAKHNYKMEEIDEEGKVKGGSKSKENDPVTQGRNLLNSIVNAKKANDDDAADTAIANYNSYAQKNGLASYSEKPGFFASVFQHIKNMKNTSNMVTVQYKGKDGKTLSKQLNKSDLDEAKKKVPDLKVVGDNADSDEQ
jgi:hypothetical protein